MSDPREVEARRFGAVQALQAVVECLRDTNPQAIFVSAKGESSSLEPMKVQSINNRWADKAGDVLLTALDLAQAIGDDGLELFKHPERGHQADA